MLSRLLWLLCLTVIDTKARTTASNEFYSTSFSTLATFQSSRTGLEYTYLSYTNGQSTVETSTSTGTRNNTDAQTTRSVTSESLTIIGGLTGNATSGTASSTSTAARATNTVPCNGYPQFCNRKYSNITNVCTHNSAYVVPNNAGSNQKLSILDQLNDGVRMCKCNITPRVISRTSLRSYSTRRDSLVQ